MLPIERHPFGVLQFSGGKDSLACLAMLKPFWSKLVVVWNNRGDAFPETIEIMEGVRRLVPHFIEVNGDAPGWIAENGWPVDVLPVSATPFGRALNGYDGPLMATSLDCCWANSWKPMQDAMRTLGATLIIRGQRNEETMKAPVRSGDVLDGVEYWFPIEDWTAEQVFDFLDTEGVELPAHYSDTSTSLDCMHCTAWLRSSEDTVRWLAKAHPEVSAEVQRRLSVIRETVSDGLAMLNACRVGV